jgi:hypothetical protein
MNRKLSTLIILAVCGTGLYFWWFSDTKVITRSTESLIECFEKEAGDSRFGAVMTTSTFRDLLDDEVSFAFKRGIIPNASGFGSRFKKGDLVEMVSSLSASSAIIKITDKNITILEIGKEQASVNLTLHVITEKLPSNLDQDINCDLTFKKIEGDWKISAAVVK